MPEAQYGSWSTGANPAAANPASANPASPGPGSTLLDPAGPGPVVLGTTGVTIDDVVTVARGTRRVSLGPEAVEAMTRSLAVTRALVDQPDAVYGLSTGFGALANRYIGPTKRAALQVGLVRSHATTVGEEVAHEVIRGMILLRARTLAMGCSGVRVDLAEGLLSLLNAGIVPVVREHGSLGCSGDLAPLAHVALALMGEGEVDDRNGRRVSAADALAKAGIAPLVLEAKEGLALTNGTDGMLAMLCLACADAKQLLKTADVAAALSAEALLGTDQAYRPELTALRPHPGQQASAANMSAVMADSEVVASHRVGDRRVQDAYSLRCAPQVLGAVRDTLDHVRTVTERELASAIDNPMVLSDGRVVSCGNFHGAPLAYVADFLAIALTDAGSIAERRIDRLLDPVRSQGLPAFLAEDPGVDSGLMLTQYTAAALVADARRLSSPASVDNIPTSAMQEDHVSMGWAATMKLRRVLDNVTAVVAIEVMAATRAVELREQRPSPATEAVLAGLRAEVPGSGPDRYMAPEIDAITRLVASGEVVSWVESVVGPLL